MEGSAPLIHGVFNGLLTTVKEGVVDNTARKYKSHVEYVAKQEAYLRSIGTHDGSSWRL